MAGEGFWVHFGEERLLLVRFFSGKKAQYEGREFPVVLLIPVVTC
ncbi:hypothetical protein SAMN05216233_11919 [Desulfoluna spongiiphila]|uniref:Uncharacterized protein n=1 Tax=Desulfoluna spongiiphila TaxID=419481 RepID=A0A1G5ICY9_9BACT|nr:hypothetical protein SAMN05216233_11919 [Desulfoluna spongiiphila]